MIIVNGTITMLDGKRDEMIAASEPMAKASREEPGCLQYRYAFDLEDENVVAFTEVWTDMQSLMGHLGTPHMAAFREATRDLITGRPDMTIYQGEEVSFG